MKKLIFLLFAFAVMFAVIAPTEVQAQRGTYTTADTVTNTDTVTWAYPTVIGGNWHMLIQVELDSVSGTAIAPTFAIQASIDNVNWYTLKTITLKPANNEAEVYELTTTPYIYYRIYVLNTGTNKSAIRSKWIWKYGTSK
jgi:hypothetical protein